VDEDLRLALQPPERLRMEDAVAVALERRTQEALLLGAPAAGGLAPAHGKPAEPGRLVRGGVRFEGVSDSSGQLRHRNRAYSVERPLEKSLRGGRARRLRPRS